MKYIRKKQLIYFFLLLLLFLLSPIVNVHDVFAAYSSSTGTYNGVSYSMNNSLSEASGVPKYTNASDAGSARNNVGTVGGSSYYYIKTNGSACAISTAQACCWTGALNNCNNHGNHNHLSTHADKAHSCNFITCWVNEGELLRRTIPPHTHSYRTVIDRYGSCSGSNKHQHCDGCGDNTNYTYKAKDHSWSWTYNKSQHYQICSRGIHKRSVSNHSIKTTVVTNSTCTAVGTHNYDCTYGNCGYKVNKNDIPPKGHSMQNIDNTVTYYREVRTGYHYTRYCTRSCCVKSSPYTSDYYDNPTANWYFMSYNGNLATSMSYVDTNKLYYYDATYSFPSVERKYTVSYVYDNGGQTTNDSTTIKYDLQGWIVDNVNKGTSFKNLTSSHGWETKYATASWKSNSTTLPSPSRIGYIFCGWWTSQDYTNTLNANSSLNHTDDGTYIGGAGDAYTPTADITLYAHWKPIAYKITYNRDVLAKGNTTDGNMKIDERTFYYDKSYNLKTLSSLGWTRFTETGYYGQTLDWHFIGWGTKSFSTLTKNDSIHPWKYLTGMTTRQYLSTKTEYSTTYVQDSNYPSTTNALYLYDGETFTNLTKTNNKDIKLYGEWIADNQRPYGGFRFQSMTYNDDGTPTGVKENIEYDSYNINNYNDVSKEIKLYDDGDYYIYEEKRDPEDNPMSTDYQFSVDNGTTWYQLTTNNVNKYGTSNFTFDGTKLNFKKDTKTLIRMRVKDTPTYKKYPQGAILQKSLWSTGYFVDNTRNEYDSNGKYVGDAGTKVNQGGSWYVKTINCYPGNKKPSGGIVAPTPPPSVEPTTPTPPSGGTPTPPVPDDGTPVPTYPSLIKTYSAFPMYDYTMNGETYNYTKGKLYFLVSNDYYKSNGNNDTVVINKLMEKASANYTSNIELIKEGSDKYTAFNPEDETIAILNASSDPDNGKHTNSPTSNFDMTHQKSYYYRNGGRISNNEAYSHFWIAICEKGTTADVLRTSNDRATTVTNRNVSNGTLYDRKYNGQTITGHIYDSYEQMISDVYTRSGFMFASISDVDLSLYDIYFAVCDKSWNLISANKWSDVIKETLVTEPELTIYDSLYNMNDNTSSVNAGFKTMFKNKYHINGYTLRNGKYLNIDNAFSSQGTSYPGVATMITRYNNSKQNYALNNSTSYVNNIAYRPGYFFGLCFRTHGAEDIDAYVTDQNGSKKQLIYNHEYANNIVNETDIHIDTRRKAINTNTFYQNDYIYFGIPEQNVNSQLNVTMTITKVPYTRPDTKLQRSITFNKLFVDDGSSSLQDIGVSQTN